MKKWIYYYRNCSIINKKMKLYLYKEGIVRFSADRYDVSRIANQFSHLTNSSINKNS